MSKLKKRADGLYQLTVMVEERGQRKRKYFYGKTQQEAKRKMMAYQDALAAGRSFEEVAKEWHRQHWPEIAAGTQTCYAPALDRALRDFSGTPVKSVAPLDIRRALERMAAQGYAHHTAVVYLSVLNQIFDYAITMQDLSENPTAAIRVPKGMHTTPRSSC